MEQVNEQEMRQYSTTPPDITKSGNGRESSHQIDLETHAALFTVINKARMLNGWGAAKRGDLDATIRVWFEAFTSFGIPADAYDALYKRAIEVRANELQRGNAPPTFGAELMISCWTGANGLRAEIEERRVRDGRTLTENAASQCPKCFGSGYEYLFDEKGRTQGIVGKCDHQGARKVRR